MKDIPHFSARIRIVCRRLSTGDNCKNGTKTQADYEYPCKGLLNRTVVDKEIQHIVFQCKASLRGIDLPRTGQKIKNRL